MAFQTPLQSPTIVLCHVLQHIPWEKLRLVNQGNGYGQLLACVSLRALIRQKLQTATVTMLSGHRRTVPYVMWALLWVKRP